MKTIMSENVARRVLRISEAATEEQVKAAYRALSKAHHPDQGGIAHRFIMIQTAYDRLCGKTYSYSAPDPAMSKAAYIRSYPDMNPTDLSWQALLDGYDISNGVVSTTRYQDSLKRGKRTAKPRQSAKRASANREPSPQAHEIDRLLARREELSRELSALDCTIADCIAQAEADLERMRQAVRAA